MNHTRPTVAIIGCADYEPAPVVRAVRAALEAGGDWPRQAQRGATVLLKPNLVSPCGPERPVCTHPAVVRAVAEVFHEAGCRLVIGDQPTYALKSDVDHVFGAPGYRAALRHLPVTWRLAAAAGYRAFPVPRPYHSRQADLSRLLDEVDLVVNLPKLKTHMQTGLTAAVKNTFGLVAPRRRMDLHFLGAGRAFGEAIADTFGAAPPALTLLDAVVAMEGHGPTRGRPRSVGALLAGADAVAVDTVAERMAGFRPGEVTTTPAAAQAGYGCAEPAALELRGEDPDRFRVRLRRASSPAGRIPAPPPGVRRSRLMALGARLLYVRPRVDRRLCTGCGQCRAACPADCIGIEGWARIDRSRCLECFCCLEACPEQAVGVQRSLLSRLM